MEMHLSEKLDYINPAMKRHPEEAAILGRLLLAFGELEFSMCRNAGEAVGMLHTILRMLYRLRTTSSRIDAADALMRAPFDDAGLCEQYELVMGMLSACVAIRNQYAHCNWADHAADPGTGLFFADLQAAADGSAGFSVSFRHIDVALLESQERFFTGTLEWLQYVNHELAVRQGRLSAHFWPKPAKLSQPLRHNPLEKHVPPWLTEDEKALHVARALAAQGGPPTPTPAQQELERKRAEKRVRSQADRERDLKGRSGGGS